MRSALMIGGAALLVLVACGSDVSVFGTPATGSTGAGGSPGTSSVSVGGNTVATSSSSSSVTTVASSSSSGDPVKDTLACGNQECPQGGQNACCYDHWNQHQGPQEKCVEGPLDNDNCRTAHTGNNNFATRIECQVPGHCAANEVCCGWRLVWEGGGQQYPYYAETACKTECEWPDIEICDDNYDCPTVTIEDEGEEKQVKLVCKQSSLLPDGYRICGTP